MDKNKLVEIFKKCWNECDLGDKIDINNMYCRENSYENEIYDNDEEFFENFFSGNPMEAVRAVLFGKFHFNHPYIWFNGYGNLETSEFEDELPLCDEDDMADWYIDNYEDIDYIDAMKEFCNACDEYEE